MGVVNKGKDVATESTTKTAIPNNPDHRPGGWSLELPSQQF